MESTYSWLLALTAICISRGVKLQSLILESKGKYRCSAIFLLAVRKADLEVWIPNLGEDAQDTVK